MKKGRRKLKNSKNLRLKKKKQLKVCLAAFNLLYKDGDTLSTKELSAIFGFGNEKEAAVMERFLKISIRKELHIEGDVT